MTNTAYTVTPKFNRCLSFTLPDGTVIDVKVIGDKSVAVVAAKRLLDVLTAAATNAD